MQDNNLILSKIKSIQSDLDKLKELQTFTFEQIVSDYIKHKALERITEVIINEAIDINHHIIANSDIKDFSFDYKKSFTILCDMKVLPSDFAQKISLSVGLRNILVHQYRDLDEEIFYASIPDCISQYTQYCQYILDYLTKK